MSNLHVLIYEGGSCTKILTEHGKVGKLEYQRVVKQQGASHILEQMVEYKIECHEGHVCIKGSKEAKDE